MSLKNNLPFDNKVVWITGASSGLGASMAYQLSQLGARLILSARNEHNLTLVNSKLPRNSGSAKILPLDLEDLDNLPSKVDQAIGFFGRIDYLVNNAGMAVRDYVMATESRVDLKLMKINYLGPVIITKSLLPYMMQQGNGHLVVISSLSGKYGVPKTAAYAAPKHALHGFFDTLRSEINNTGIFITIIIPGIIKTAITAHAVRGNGELSGKIEKSFQSGYPVDRAISKSINAILNKKEEVFVGGMEGFTLALNRVSPSLLKRVIRNHPLKFLRRFKLKV